MAYVTIEQVMRAIVKDEADAAEVPTFELAIEGVSSFIDEYCGRTFTRTTPATEREFFVDGGGRSVILGDMAAPPSLVTWRYNYADTAVALAAGTAWTTVPPRKPGRPYRMLRRLDMDVWPAGYLVATAEWGWPATPGLIYTTAITLISRWWQASKMGFPDAMGTDQTGEMQWTRLLTQAERLALQSVWLKGAAY